MISFRRQKNQNKILTQDTEDNYREFQTTSKINNSTMSLTIKSLCGKNIRKESATSPESNRRQNKNAAFVLMARSVRSTHSGRTAQVKQRLIRMLIVIVIIFFCCWTPSYIWWLLLNAQDSFGVKKFSIK